jgi:hypothetical protein
VSNPELDTDFLGRLDSFEDALSLRALNSEGTILVRVEKLLWLCDAARTMGVRLDPRAPFRAHLRRMQDEFRNGGCVYAWVNGGKIPLRAVHGFAPEESGDVFSGEMFGGTPVYFTAFSTDHFSTEDSVGDS